MRKAAAGVVLVSLIGVGLFGAFFVGRSRSHTARVSVASTLAARSAAAISTTPGWECVPTAAGQAVISGGTGPAPSCAAGTTAVLAPTFVSSGVGGKPTVVFSSINLQIVSGSGATDAAVNGEGNLVVGYAENNAGRSRTGSNNLIVGSENGWTGYGGIVGGLSNVATGKYDAVVGNLNTTSGSFSFAAGERNKATGRYSSILGGNGNTAATNCQSIPATPGPC